MLNHPDMIGFRSQCSGQTIIKLTITMNSNFWYSKILISKQNKNQQGRLFIVSQLRLGNCWSKHLCFLKSAWDDKLKSLSCRVTLSYDQHNLVEIIWERLKLKAYNSVHFQDQGNFYYLRSVSAVINAPNRLSIR